MRLSVVLYQTIPAARLDQAVVAIEIETLTRRRPVAEPVLGLIAVGWSDVALEWDLTDTGETHHEGPRIAFEGRLLVPERVKRGHG